jgi:hypothetical protein
LINTLYKNPKLVAIAQACLGNDLCHYLSRLLVKDETATLPIECHQDWPYYTGDSQKLAIMVPLTEHSESNGKLYFISGSHKFGPLARGRINYERFPDLPRIGPDLQVGDVLLHHFLTWHYSVPSQTGEDRAILQIVYQPSTDPTSKTVVSGEIKNPYSAYGVAGVMSRIDLPYYALSVAQARAAWEAGDKETPAKVCAGLINEEDRSHFSARALLAEMATSQGRVDDALSQLEEMRKQQALIAAEIERIQAKCLIDSQ